MVMNLKQGYLKKLYDIYINIEDVKIPGKEKRAYQLCKQVYSTKNK